MLLFAWFGVHERAPWGDEGKVEDRAPHRPLWKSILEGCPQRGSLNLEECLQFLGRRLQTLCCCVRILSGFRELPWAVLDF